MKIQHRRLPHLCVALTSLTHLLPDSLAAAPTGTPWAFWAGSLEPHRGYEFGSGLKKGGKKLSDIDRVPAFWPDHPTVRTDILDYAYEVESLDAHLGRMLASLEQRGLLDSTLVVWGGEFGRMPFSEGEGKPGRNHNPYGFSMWMAGGGVKGGTIYGATDELGFAAVENRVHVHDLHATILALLGLDHTRLTYFHLGRDDRLTDVYGRVISEIMA